MTTTTPVGLKTQRMKLRRVQKLRPTATGGPRYRLHFAGGLTHDTRPDALGVTGILVAWRDCEVDVQFDGHGQVLNCYLALLPHCPDCRKVHDPRPCAANGDSCDCCAAMYSSPEGRAYACSILNGVTTP